MSGALADEMTPVPVKGHGGERIVQADGQPHRTAIDRVAQWRPAFRQARLDTGVIHRHAGACLAANSADNTAIGQIGLLAGQVVAVTPR